MANPLGVAIPLYGFDYYGYILPARLIRSILTIVRSILTIVRSTLTMATSLIISQCLLLGSLGLYLLSLGLHLLWLHPLTVAIPRWLCLLWLFHYGFAYYGYILTILTMGLLLGSYSDR